MMESAVPSQPMGELNTTPLIDVMLVLLIMFIITIPVSTHQVPLDLPGPPRTEEEQRLFHRLELDAAGALSWNGRPVAEAELPGLLAAAQAGGADPEIHLRAESDTPYGVFDRVLATVKKAGVERLGMVGNERFAAAPGL